MKPCTTAVTEKGIILDAMRVRAALDGRLTQIRVRVNPQPVIGMMFDKLNCQFYDNGNCDGATVHDPINCPYSIGTRLWVREAWCGHWAANPEHIRNTKQHSIELNAGEEIKQNNGSTTQTSYDNPLFIYHRATFGDTPPMVHLKWRSSASMPRAFSRLTLEVKAVRVEKVNEISHKDALAEGVGCHTCKSRGWLYGEGCNAFTQYNKTYRQCPDCAAGARAAGKQWEGVDWTGLHGEYVVRNPLTEFELLYDSLHGPGSFAAGHWVWVLEVERK